MSNQHVELNSEIQKPEETPETPQTNDPQAQSQAEIVYQQGEPVIPQQYPQQYPYPQAPQQQNYYQPQFMYMPQGQQGNMYPPQQFVQMPMPGQMIFPVSRTCRKPVESMVHYDVGNGTYIVGGLLCLFGLSLGCCLIPSFVEDCKDAQHYCPYCGNLIGVKKFLFE